MNIWIRIYRNVLSISLLVMLISFHTQIININPTCGVYAGGGVSGPWIEEVDHYSQTEQEKKLVLNDQLAVQ